MDKQNLVDKAFNLCITGFAIALGALLFVSVMSVVATFLIGLAPVVAGAIVIGLIYYRFKE
jgi:CHASE2 domain-containing sensor protein